ncbi:MAG: 23S rRNA (adenine(2503)-C(2))-methyltransferase RlmN [Anaerolineae bacterium]|jgi:23S rRNA (adenine2503-C2)-methyltransferase
MATLETAVSASQPACLYDLDLSEIEALFESWGEPPYRADQVWEWLYVHLVDSFDEMTNLPKRLRHRLAQQTTLDVLDLVDTSRTADGRTRKDLLELRDGEMVEAVLMRYETRRTACLSTQVGCAMGCPFCATGQMGFRRDLSRSEILAQAIHFARCLQLEGERLTNVVLMGMGEPLANYDNSLGAIRRMINPDGFRLGQRHITLSTVGLVPEIRKLAQEDLQITLAISLHAATDQLRDQLVPVNRRYDLDVLFRACADYVDQTGRRISFEWALIHGLNDTPEQALALADRLHSSLPDNLAHVNLIPLNPSPGYVGARATRDSVQTFTSILERRRVPYTVRVGRGAAIQAGCGQLRQRGEGK